MNKEEFHSLLVKKQELEAQLEPYEDLLMERHRQSRPGGFLDRIVEIDDDLITYVVCRFDDYMAWSMTLNEMFDNGIETE